ncbi:MAG: flagellar hook-length control protein FliK [Lachnospiraceae bacterium]|nr:flagellar hook-length control protein FliK [Lachnospiraceae bacterium]
MTSTPVMSSINTQAANLLNSVTNNITKAGGEDFKNFMDLAANDNQTLETNTNKPVKVEKNDLSRQTNDTETATAKSAGNNEKPAAPAKETKEVSDTDVNKVDDAIDAVKEVLEEELKVTDEEILEVLESLGLNLAALLDPDKLPQIITELTDSPDVLAIATDPELYRVLTDVKQEVTEAVADITEALDIPTEDFNEALKEIETLPMNTAVEPETSEIPEEFKAETELVNDTAKTESLAEKIQITVTPKAKERVGLTTEEPKEEEQEPVKVSDSKQTAVSDLADSETETFKPVENKSTFSFAETDRKEEIKADPALNFAKELIGRAVENFKEIAEVQESYTNIDVADVLNQITESIKVEISPETSEINLRLHPESLGSVTVKVSQNHEGVMRAQFTTQNESVKAIVESQAIVLKEALESKGVKVEAVEVLVQSHEFERNLSDQNKQSGANEQQGKTRKIRRINLTEGPVETEEPEDTLVREMMAANGSTIDYSA